MTLAGSKLRVTDPFAVLSESAEVDGRREALIRRIGQKYMGDVAPQPPGDIPWDAGFFGLDRSTRFRDLPLPRQVAVTAALSEAVLREAQHIEVVGTTYAAKMALLAETLPQRELYSFFAADEARHLRLISALVGEPHLDWVQGNSFLGYLAQVVQDEDRETLVFLIQVILEGWGINYYSALARCARAPQVTRCFETILLDEGRHHGSGLVLFDESRLTMPQLARLKDLLAAFLAMVRIGPAATLAHLARETGGMSRSEIHDFLTEVDFAAKVKADLSLMQSLLVKAGAHKLRQFFVEKAAFTVPTAAACASDAAAFLGGVL